MRFFAMMAAAVALVSAESVVPEATPIDEETEARRVVKRVVYVRVNGRCYPKQSSPTILYKQRKTIKKIFIGYGAVSCHAPGA